MSSSPTKAKNRYAANNVKIEKILANFRPDGSAKNQTRTNGDVHDQKQKQTDLKTDAIKE